MERITRTFYVKFRTRTVIAVGISQGEEVKKLFLTASVALDDSPPRRELFEFAESTFKPYAAKHGYDYRAAWYDNIDCDRWPGLIEGRTPLWKGHGNRTSPCWLKIPAICEALESYDFVLYLDHDCAVLDDSEDAESALPSCKTIGMLDSFIGGPCIGFVLTRSTPLSRQFWRLAWDIDAWKTATWTDNGQVLALLGFTTTAPAIWLSPTAYTHTFERLPEPWGGVGAPYGGKPFIDIARIYHAAYHASPEWKLAVLKDALQRKKCLTKI